MLFGHIIQDGHKENSMFSEKDTVHRFNPTYTPRRLREDFLALGIEINTTDIDAGNDISFELHIEGRPLENNTTPKYLIATETPFINKLNADKKYLSNFKQVFTWNQSLLSLPNVSQIFFPSKTTWEPSPKFEERNIFTCLINANKAFPEPLKNDLYRERISTIRWYEANAPELFHLYGLGWHKPPPAFTTKEKITRRIARLRSQLFSYKPFPSYKGEIANKHGVLKNSKFSICYENVKNQPNWITEKIFDSLLAGCVPVYWGADNISHHIPNNCFIDRRKFTCTAEMHSYLSTITNQQHQTYQDNIKKFLTTGDAKKFSTESYSKIITEKIYNDITSNYLGQ